MALISGVKKRKYGYRRSGDPQASPDTKARRKQLYGTQKSSGFHSGGQSDVKLTESGAKTDPFAVQRAGNALSKQGSQGQEQYNQLLEQHGLTSRDMLTVKTFLDHMKAGKTQTPQVEGQVTPTQESGLESNQTVPEEPSFRTIFDNPNPFGLNLDTATGEGLLTDTKGELGRIAKGTGLGVGIASFASLGATLGKQALTKAGLMSRNAASTQITKAAAGQAARDKAFIKELSKRTGLKLKSTKGLVGRQITLAEGRNYAMSQVNTKTATLTGSWLSKITQHQNVILTAIGSYPFSGFLKEEAIQIIGFGVLIAKDGGDLEGEAEALRINEEILNPETWRKIIDAVPYANSIAALNDFWKSAVQKFKIDLADFKRRREGIPSPEDIKFQEIAEKGEEKSERIEEGAQSGRRFSYLHSKKINKEPFTTEEEIEYRELGGE